jgi:hypothetical protein
MSEESLHEPSSKFNCYDGYRVKTEKHRLSEEIGGIKLSLALYGNGKELFSSVLAHQPDTIEGQATLSRLQALATCLASYFNCCGTVDELLTTLAGIRNMVEQATIEPPEGWKFYQLISDDRVDEHQYLFLNEESERVLIVVPDTYTEDVPLADLEEDDAVEEAE